MRIFIIDDDELSIFLTENLLLIEDETLETITFLSAIEASETLSMNADNLPDIILLDLNMPVMDGWSFLDTLTPLKPKLYGRCNVFILSSSVDTDDINKAGEYSIVSGFIHKPLKSEDIKYMLSQINVSNCNTLT